MEYTIGKISRATGLPVSTIRYYDKEGLLGEVRRSPSGIRLFDDTNLGNLRIVECLKGSGMSLDGIKKYMEMLREGDSTLEKRKELFSERLSQVEKDIRQLRKVRDMLEYKCWYYDQTIKAGTEEVFKEMGPDDLPREIKPLAEGFSEYSKKFESLK